VGPEIDVPTSDSTRGDAHSCDLRVGRDSGKPACSPCKYKRRMSTIARDLTRSAVDAVVGARTALGWSQRRLALVAGVSQTFVSRFERGAAETVTVESVGRMFDALGIRAELRTELPILGGQRRQADVVHAWTCGYVGRRLAGEGWDVRHEVEVGTGRFRGWIDVLGYRPTDRSLVINECKTDILDVGAIQRTTNWYQREAWVAARRFGWRPVRAVVALLLLDSEEVEARLRMNRPVLAASFPGRAAQLTLWFRQPGAPPADNCLALIDPAWRGRHWLRPSRADGRRCRNRYANYADAVDRLRRRRP
jgi:transcriptional regulator with XRE-family HTH domain